MLRHQLPPRRAAGSCRLKWHFCDRSAEINSEPFAVRPRRTRSDICSIYANERSVFRGRGSAKLQCETVCDMSLCGAILWLLLLRPPHNTIMCHWRWEQLMYDSGLEWSGLKNSRFFKALLERHYFMKSNVRRQARDPYLFIFPSKTVIEINIIPRATFVYKQCPYCNPAGSWKWNKAFNELAALNPWGLPHTRTQRQSEVEVERGEREGKRERGNIFATWECEWDTEAKQH